MAYRIYRRPQDGLSFEKVGEIRGRVYQDSTLRAGRSYAYYARALDAAGNVSSLGGIVTITPR